MKTTAREAVLAALPGIESEIVEKTGYSRSTVVYWLRRFREEDVARVIGYRRPTGQGHRFARIYGLGSKPDVICHLKRLPFRILQARAREKAKKDGRMEEWRAKEKARYWANKALIKKANPFSQLFVQARGKS
jgi:methionyl-tRNA formyltransferase